MAFNLGRALDDLHRSLHAFLAPRGWTLDGYGPDPISDDFDSYPTWRYTASYGGIEFQVFTDVTPDDMICTIEFGKGHNDSDVVEVETIGNRNSCERHVRTIHHVEIKDDELDLDELGTLLDRLEPHAAAGNPRELIECMFLRRLRTRLHRPVISNRSLAHSRPKCRHAHAHASSQPGPMPRRGQRTPKADTLRQNESH
jgi:hypothetical protein